MSMPVTTLASSETIKTSTASREASFSSYLDGDEKTFILKLGATPSVDKEIDVFDAQKYFNDSPSRSPNLGVKSFSVHDLKKDVFPAAVKEQTPSIAAASVRSQSSWNSRSSLLQTVPRRHKAKNKSFLSSIGCNCSCLTASIIDGRSKTKEKMQLQEREEAVKRRSQSPVHVKGKKNCFNMEKKLNVVTWDGITPLSAAEELKIPSISSEMHNGHDHDSDSDASSDLFEIESLYIDNPYDPAACYAPSEASIEWSVVTASAADFSLLSDTDEVSSTIQTPCIKKSGLNSRTCSFKEMPKIRPSILSGCKSQKSVSVAGDAHARRPLTPMTRFHDESKLSFDAKKRPNSFDHRILSQPRSATSARLLYTCTSRKSTPAPNMVKKRTQKLALVSFLFAIFSQSASRLPPILFSILHCQISLKYNLQRYKNHYSSIIKNWAVYFASFIVLPFINWMQVNTTKSNNESKIFKSSSTEMK